MFTLYRWLYNQFGFSRSQSNGFLVLLPLMLLIIVSGPFYRSLTDNHRLGNQADIRILDSLVALMTTPPQPRANDSLFYFDPHTLSSAELQRLGFTEPVATRIRRYVEKGGRFKRKADLLRIHGIDSALFELIEPYILLPEETGRPNKNVQPPQKQKRERFDLNLVDTVQLKRVRGIGSKLANRIVRYRDALGGFHSVEQLREVYGLDSTRVLELQKHVFVDPGFPLSKININTAGRQELANHPYFSPRQAGSIVAYRFAHGNFGAIEDLGKIGTIDSITFRKMMPYLTTE